MTDLAPILQGTLTMATPLLLAALGETVVQKSGVVNVGLEGMMLAGAFAATVGAISAHNPYAGLLAAALAGASLAAVFALFAVRLAANQVVAGVVINLLALGLTGTIYRARFGVTGDFIKAPLLPPLFLGQNALALLSFLMVPALWLWFFRTRSGLTLRACGEQPHAAEATGAHTLRIRTYATLFGGAMAGLAGAFLAVGISGTFIENMTGGRGFIALAIVTSGRWSAWGCLVAAILFGLVEQLQFVGQAQGWKAPYQLFLALPYVVTLGILIAGGKQSQAPEALGRPYRKA